MADEDKISIAESIPKSVKSIKKNTMKNSKDSRPIKSETENLARSIIKPKETVEEEVVLFKHIEEKIESPKSIKRVSNAPKISEKINRFEIDNSDNRNDTILEIDAIKPMTGTKSPVKQSHDFSVISQQIKVIVSIEG